MFREEFADRVCCGSDFDWGADAGAGMRGNEKVFCDKLREWNPGGDHFNRSLVEKFQANPG
jgi:hypothetical protein